MFWHSLARSVGAGLTWSKNRWRAKKSSSNSISPMKRAGHWVAFGIEIVLPPWNRQIKRQRDIILNYIIDKQLNSDLERIM